MPHNPRDRLLSFHHGVMAEAEENRQGLIKTLREMQENMQKNPASTDVQKKLDDEFEAVIGRLHGDTKVTHERIARLKGAVAAYDEEKHLKRGKSWIKTLDSVIRQMESWGFAERQPREAKPPASRA